MRRPLFRFFRQGLGTRLGLDRYELPDCLFVSSREMWQRPLRHSLSRALSCPHARPAPSLWQRWTPFWTGWPWSPRRRTRRPSSQRSSEGKPAGCSHTLRIALRINCDTRTFHSTSLQVWRFGCQATTNHFIIHAFTHTQYYGIYMYVVYVQSI